MRTPKHPTTDEWNKKQEVLAYTCTQWNPMHSQGSVCEQLTYAPKQTSAAALCFDLLLFYIIII